MAAAVAPRSLSQYFLMLQEKATKLDLKPCFVHPSCDVASDIALVVKGQRLFRDHVWTVDDESALTSLFAAYINEIWLSEFPEHSESKLDTAEVVEMLFRKPSLDEFAIIARLQGSARDPERVCTKLQNLLAASRFLFGNNLRDHSVGDWNVDLIKTVHRMVGAKVVADAGEYRKEVRGAVGSTVVYALPSRIAARMEDLVTFTKLKKAEYMQNLDEATKTRRMIVLGALFFSEFLLIHPFSNGNGRTARLLLNCFLREITFVPFSLYFKSRQLYIDVLEERNRQTEPPHALALYLLQCVVRTCSNLSFLLID